MNAALLTIGEEILIGQIIDTNSAWLGNELSLIGISVRNITSISDSSDDIKDAISQLLGKYDIVISTGGLGPTSDDITKNTLCEYFNSELVLHEPTLELIRQIFTKRGLPLTELNAKQAEVPLVCEILLNPLGTAPGMWFKPNGKIFISLPGVPFEMKAIMEQTVLPRLKAMVGSRVIIHKTIHTFGLPESFLAQMLEQWELELPRDIKVAYLPCPTSIRLRLTSSGANRDIIERNIQEQINKLYTIIPDYIFGYDKDTMAEVVGHLLRERKETLTLAESCTGGTIAHLVTQVSGSSSYFLGGIVAYSNEVKINELRVPKELIEQFGAVSQQVVEAMAIGVRKKFMTDFSIATSGIAGPTGATTGKPVGTVWVAVTSRNKTVSQSFNFGSDRERNILRSSVTALNMLRLFISEEKKLK